MAGANGSCLSNGVTNLQLDDKPTVSLGNTRKEKKTTSCDMELPTPGNRMYDVSEHTVLTEEW